jgi:SAM-dependent methyltransferase
MALAWGAFLLFAVQPMVARMALPSLGGTAAVWTTCMVFFQAVLLAGYGLAHGLQGWAGGRWQVWGFLGVAVLGLFWLPPGLEMESRAVESPVGWLVGRLLWGVAGPALALGVASPLLQRWYGGGTGGRDPYFLYVSSNAGSLGALLAYPLVVERRWTLEEQGAMWGVGYGMWVMGMVGLAVWYAHRVSVGRGGAEWVGKDRAESHGTEWVGGGVGRWWVWVGLAAVPASLLQGCSLFLSTEVLSVPWMWVAPLGLYLVSFMVAFSTRGAGVVRVANRVLPYMAVGLVFVILSRSTTPVAGLLVLHLGFLLAAGLVAHGRLVAMRPGAEGLTGFYLALAVGGLVGGVFNTVVAPRVFATVAEYPLMVAVVCAVVRPWRVQGKGGRRWMGDVGWGLGMGGLTVGLGVLAGEWLAEQERWRMAVALGLPAVGCAVLMDRPVRMAWAVAFTFLAGSWMEGRWAGIQAVERSFFGVTRVLRDEGRGMHVLMHGNTLHGRQFLDPARQAEPLSYYHRTGPLGAVFEEFQRRPGALRVGVIGLGVGSMAAYARAEEAWVFYEIDPAVIHVAQDERWFRYWSQAKERAGELRVVEGDGRLGLRSEKEGSLDLIVVDAFSSDAIPVHLLTREALAEYRSRLRPGGWLVLHISNRYLMLEPVVAALAADAGWVSRSGDDATEDLAGGREPSHWMVLAESDEALGALGKRIDWWKGEGADEVEVWTDQRASVWPVFQWR